MFTLCYIKLSSLPLVYHNLGTTDLVEHVYYTNWEVEAHRGRVLPKVTQPFRGWTGSYLFNEHLLCTQPLAKPIIQISRFT